MLGMIGIVFSSQLTFSFEYENFTKKSITSSPSQTTGAGGGGLASEAGLASWASASGDGGRPASAPPVSAEMGVASAHWHGV